MQITVFSNDGRFPVQFELMGMTQQYRFRHGPHLRNLGDIAAILDDEFKSGVMKNFERMRAIHARVVTDHLSAPTDTSLPDIV